MVSLRLRVAMLLILATAAPLRALAAPQRLAVLELRGDLEPAVLAALTDQLRDGALTALRGTGTEVMTRENMAVVARDMGLDLACAEAGAECEVDIGRNIGASLIVSGSVLSAEGLVLTTLKLHDTDKGNLLATETLQVGKWPELVPQLPGATEQLIREGMGVTAGPAPTGGSIRAERGGFSLETSTEHVVSFETDPAGAVVLVDGQLLCQSTPCSKRLGAGSHRVEAQRERHRPSRTTIDVRESMKPVILALVPTFGWLTVETKPPGLDVRLDGKAAGTSPLQSVERDPGVAEVLLASPCHLPDGERVVIAEGQRARVLVTARERIAGLRVDVEDSQGNALEGSVLLDGRRIGDAPGPFEVPFCGKSVEVKTSAGNWKGAVALTENQVATVRAVVATGAKASDSGRAEASDAVVMDYWSWVRTPASQALAERDNENRRRDLARLPDPRVLDELPGAVRADLALARAELEAGQVRYELDQGRTDRASAAARDAAATLRTLVHDYPRYSKADKALLLLGRAEAALGNEAESNKAYKDLVKTYPESEFVPDAYTAMGEHYFTHNNAFKALQNYKRAAQFKDSAPYPFALYKMAWCYFNVGEHATAISTMKELVAEEDRRTGAPRAGIPLGDEALRDLARFFSTAGDLDAGRDYLNRLGRADLARALSGP